jgi:integrase
LTTPRRWGEGTVYRRPEAGGGEAWYGRWEGRAINGKRRQFNRKLGPVATRGRADGLTEKQALKELSKRMNAEDARPIVRPDRITFATAADRTLDHFGSRPKRPLERRTLATYRSAVKTHLSKRWGTRAVAEIEPADVTKLVADLGTAGKADKTILNVYALASQIFDHAVSQGWRPDNPCSRVEAPTVAERDEINYLTPPEIGALTRAVSLDDDYGSSDRALYTVAAKCGLRQGELLALRWRDVDWAASRIRVSRSFDRKQDKAPKSKAGRRSVPLPLSAAVELERHSKATAYDGPDDRVFCNPETGRPLDHSKLSRRFKVALKAAGLTPIRFHDLRHSYGTRLAAAGVDLVKIKTWMGHKDIATTMIYAHYQPAEDEAGMVEAAFSIPSTHLSTQVAPAAT